MVLFVLAARFVLALVFLVAGVAKLRDRPGFGATLVAFGVTGAATSVATTVIPLAELGVGIALLLTPLAAAALLVAGFLLVVFTIAAAIIMARGTPADCACFGATTAEPIGPTTLIRNVCLLALVIFVAGMGPGDGVVTAVEEWTRLAGRERILGVAAALLLLILAALSVAVGRLRNENRRHARRIGMLETELRRHQKAPVQDLGAGGLSIGSLAPPFDLPLLEGDRASLTSLTANGRTAALIFMSAHCPACQELWPDIEAWQSGASEHLRVAVVCSGSAQTVEMKVMGHHVTNIILEGDTQVAEAYGLSLKPSVVLVAPTGLIDSRSVAGVGAIRALVNAALTVK